MLFFPILFNHSDIRDHLIRSSTSSRYLAKFQPTIIAAIAFIQNKGTTSYCPALRLTGEFKKMSMVVPP